MERTLKAEQAALREGGITLRGAEAKLAANTDRLRVLFDEALALHAWDIGAGMMVRDDIAAGIDLIASMPPEGIAGDATRAWLASVQRGVNAGSLIKDDATRQAYERLHDLVKYDEWNLSLADEALTTATTKLEDLDAGKFGGILDSVKNRVLEGWEPIEGLGVQVPNEVLDVWKPNLEKLFAKKNRSQVFKSMDYLNKLFKTYAIATPGFVIRNLYSALFTNGVAGVDPQTMLDGWKAAHYYNKYGAGRWLDELGVTGLERQQYEQAMLAVEAAGRRGDFTELVEPMVGGTRRERVANTILNNPWTKLVRGANTRVEDAVRLPLALKSIRQGDNYVTAAQQVTRYHFDYTDLSQFDERALKLIPFWIWTTRNIPNQLANQWMRPQVYSLWENLQESLPADDNVLMPSWLQDYEPLGFSRFGVAGNIILRPDLPHQRLERTLRDLTSERVFGQMYPIPKLVAEKIARRNLALDIPFRDEARVAEGIDKPIAELLNAVGNPFGLTKKERNVETGEDEVRTTDFLQYATGNFVPLIATLQRLAGGKLGGKESYEDRQASAWATFLGVPVDFITDRMQGSEAIGRQFNIADYISELNKIGYVEDKDVTTKRASDLKKANEAASKKAKNDRINQLLSERLRIKDRYGEKSAEYKAITKQINDARNPTTRQRQLDENYIILRYGKDSPEHKLFLAKQRRVEP